MKLSSTEHWKSYGKTNPYFGVLSDDKYKTDNMTEDSLAEFFESGESFVKETEERLNLSFQESLANKSILDFGCGVGRLSLAFGKVPGSTVTGIDISQEMLAEAQRNGDSLGLTNVKFHQYNGYELLLTEKFDFINSYIVFQHIERPTGFRLLNELCQGMNMGAIAQLHLTYGHNLGKMKYLNFYLRTNSSLYNFLYSLLRLGKLKPELVMQMNQYQPEKVFEVVARYASKIHVEFTNHGGFFGAIYSFKRDK